MNKHIIFSLASLLPIVISSAALAAPFGDMDDADYAKKLWAAMEQDNYVGSHRIMSTPYAGQPPHGAILDTIEGPLSVEGMSSYVIVKRNYGGADVSKETVANNPEKYLKAVTVMFKRPGYDADNNNWFWVKYKPNGKLHTNPKGVLLAGRVAKGMPKGCIACHTGAPGGDMVFNHDRLGSR
jgi:hypothetical protein